MLRLLLLRHAKSSWAGSGTDHDRPLAPRGLSDAPRMGRYMVEHGLIPDLVLCSTALRARQTLEGVLAGFDRLPEVRHTREIYNSGAPGLLELIAREGGEAADLLVVGHNPTMQDLALRLVAGGDRAIRRDLEEKYPTAALTVVEFGAPAWDRVEWNDGRLRRFIKPRELAPAKS